MAGQTSAPEVSGWKAGVISHLRSGQVSRVVYGSIIGLAFILTLERHPPAIGTVIGSLIATGVAVALAELYSEALGASTRVGLGGEAEPWSVVIEDTIAVFFGVAFPVIFFIFAWVGWIELQTAFDLATWTGLALIAAYGFLAARLSGSSTLRALLQASGIAVVAGVLIAVKALLH